MISSAWSAIVSEERSHALARAREAFHSSFDKIEETLPVNEDVLEAAYEAAVQAAKVILRTMKIGDGWQEHKKGVVGGFKDAYDSLVAKNATVSSDLCRKILKREWGIMHGRISSGDYAKTDCGSLGSDWQKVVTTYNDEAKGPSRSTVLLAFLSAGFVDGLLRLSDGLRKGRMDKEKDMEAKVSHAVVTNVDNESDPVPR